ncbi:MAG: GNAT family N-acetyltransferase [Rhizobiales bacterium]|nr:GNAT family N-acetyltransferase [Hyphomicrobiales bacterium]
MTDAVDIRPLTGNDRAAWEPLWNGYLAFYKATLPPGTTDVTWNRLLDDAEPMFVLGAFVDGTLLGIVHYLFHRSTWSAGGYCYLQDLFVAGEARGCGLGRALIEAVYEKAREAGVGRVYWLTHESNATARKLYDAVADNAGFIQYRRQF